LLYRRFFSFIHFHLSILSLNCWAICVLFRKLALIPWRSESQRPYVFSHVEYRLNTNYSQYYEKQIMWTEVTYERGDERGSYEGKYGWYTLCTRMNIEFLNLLKSP
jgi:hypothetical protein